MIYTDGGFWKEKKQGMHAFAITRKGEVIAKDVGWVLAASSFNAEIEALLCALEWLTEHNDMVNKDDVYILIDNKGVIQLFLQMQARSIQMTMLRINLILADLLSRNQRLTLHFSHCPSHSGVHFNELVDRMASEFIINNPHPPIVLKQHFIDARILKADADWRESSRLTSYRGWGWLMIRRNKRVFTPQVKNKGA